jgi:hypothetical protein
MITPYAYSYVPGAQTGAAHLSGVRNMLVESRHWEQHTDTGTVLTIKDQATGNLRIEMTQAANNIGVRFSHNAGVLWTASRNMAGASTFAASDLNASTAIAWIVETEDSFSLYTSAGGTTTGGTGVTTPLGYCIHAGAIGMPDNRSDDGLGIGVYGVLCGQPNPYRNTTSTRSAIQTNATNANLATMLLGSSYENVYFTAAFDNFIRGRNATSVTYWPAVDRNLSAPLGDLGEIERFPALRLLGVTSGTSFQLRYWRARYYAINDTDPRPGIGSIDTMTTVPSSSGLVWRHSVYGNLNTVVNNELAQNIVYLWASTVQAV